MLIIYKKVGGILKKVISIVLALCLSGCAVLDVFTGNKNNHSMNSTQDNTETTVDSKNEIGIFVSHDPIIKSYIDASYKMQDGKLIKSTF